MSIDKVFSDLRNMPVAPSPTMAPSYEDQGRGYDSGARGYELQGRRTAPRGVDINGEWEGCGALDKSAMDAVMGYDLRKRTIIAFTGLAGSGKSTAALHLVERHGFHRVRFAGPLKDMMRALGMTEAEIEGDRKEVPCALLGGKTPRHAMQTIGSEWGRDLIDPDLWIRAWQAAVAKVPAGLPVVVDDCRFPNEADAVLAAGGVIIRVVRYQGVSTVAARHSSESHELPASLVLHNYDIGPYLDSVDQLAVTASWAFAASADSVPQR